MRICRSNWKRAAAAAVLVLASVPATGQEYPSKPIRLVVGFPPGGTMDVYARILVKPLQDRLKTPVFVDNRPGAGGMIAAAGVARADPDGYTLLHIAPSTLSKVFVKDPPLDFNKALQPIASYWTSPFVLTINTQVPATTAKEFVDYAKANPGKLNYGSTNAVSMLPMAMLAGIAGLELQRIEYKANPQVHTALLTNELQATVSTIQAIQPLMNSGKIRILMVTGSQRLAAIPNVPTTTEAGYPGLQPFVIGTIMGPTGMPAAASAKLAAVMKEIVAMPDIDKLLSGNGRALNVSLDELSRLLREEEALWATAAKMAGYKPE